MEHPIDIGPDTDECLHPPDAVFWNPYNEVIQCHRCGEVTVSENLTRALARLADEYGPRGVVLAAQQMWPDAALAPAETEEAEPTEDRGLSGFCDHAACPPSGCQVTDDRCPECDGHGEIMLPEYEGNGYPCDVCHGTGKARPASCPTCGSKSRDHARLGCMVDGLDPWHGEAG